VSPLFGLLVAPVFQECSLLDNGEHYLLCCCNSMLYERSFCQHEIKYSFSAFMDKNVYFRRLKIG
jgi:hypothetical protein